jgi:hypothetical protein
MFFSRLRNYCLQSKLKKSVRIETTVRQKMGVELISEISCIYPEYCQQFSSLWRRWSLVNKCSDETIYEYKQAVSRYITLINVMWGAKFSVLSTYQTKRERGRMEVQLHEFLNALDESEWSVSHPFYFTPKETAPDTNWIESWMGPRADLYTMRKKSYVQGIKPQFLSRPVGIIFTTLNEIFRLSFT